MTIGGATLASFGVTPGVLSEPGAEGSTGFSAKTGTRTPDELAEDLLNLFDRCRKVVNKDV